MATKIYRENNYIYVQENGILDPLDYPAKDVKISKEQNNLYYIRYNDNLIIEPINVLDIVDKNGIPYSNFEDWKNQNSGNNINVSDSATNTNQVIGNNSLNNIDNKIPNQINNTLPISQGKTNFIFDSGNSTTMSLNAGQTFTGTLYDVTGFTSISLLVYGSQNLTVTINQFIDNSGFQLCETEQFSYISGERMPIARDLNGNFIQIIVKNEGPIATTSLNVNTYYGIIPENDSLNDNYLIGQGSQTATINNILTPLAGLSGLDIQKYRSFTCQVVSTGTGGTYIFEGSNDGLNWQAAPVYNQAIPTRVPIVTAITAASSSIIYEGSCNFRFLRLRIVTTITGGSIRAFTSLIHQPLSTTIQPIANGAAASLQATVSGTATITPTNSTSHTLNSAATTNATSVKTTAGNLYSISISNISASIRYLKLYNKTSAPTVGTDIPILTLTIPANNVLLFNLGQLGFRFTSGIAYAITGAAVDTDTTIIGASEVKVITSYL